MRAAALFVALVLASLSCLQAGDWLEFAIPDEGRITLGVFDSSGKLARTLHKLAKEEDFRIGLNGLITSWDGKNDAGELVPPGHYYVRGYLIGEDVRVSGENFFFNDWATDKAFPGFKRIEDFCLLENGDVILLADAGASGRILARFALEKGFLWSSEIALREPDHVPGTDPAGHYLGRSILTWRSPYNPPKPPMLATNSLSAFAITDAGMSVYTLDDGKKRDFVPRTAGVAPTAIAANESNLFISSSGGLAEAVLPDLSYDHITWPENFALAVARFTSMDADASALIGCSRDGVWIRQQSFTPVTLPAAAKSVALGTPGTFWFVGVDDGAAFVAQASFDGGILRMLRPSNDDPKPEKIRASRTSEKFAVIESLPGLERLRVMARGETGEWTIEWERTLRECETFGFVDGEPSANAGGAPQDKNLRLRLKGNPLTGKHDFLTVHAESDSSGSRLVSPDGLPLVEVSSRPDVRRVVIHRGKTPDTIRLLQGNGSFVEEFSISGLDDILPLDAGGMDVP